MSSKYNIFQAIPMSFFSKDLYRDIALNWHGKSFLYLFVLLAIVWIPVTMEIQYFADKWYEHESPLIVAQIPIMTIKDGVMSTPEKRPYFINNPDDAKDRIGVIDTTGEFKTLADAKASFLVTSTELITKNGKDQISVYKLVEYGNTTIDPKEVNDTVKHYLPYAWIFFYLMVLVISYIYRIIQGLFYSLIGLMFNSSAHAGLRYGQILQIALVAVTPAIIIYTALSLVGIMIPFGFIIYFIITMAFLYFGISANQLHTDIVVVNHDVPVVRHDEPKV